MWRLEWDLELLAEPSDELQDARWVDADPPRRFAWAVEDPDRPATLRSFQLSASRTGRSLSQHVRLGPGPSGLTARIEEEPDREHELLACRLWMLRSGVQATVELIARRARRIRER